MLLIFCVEVRNRSFKLFSNIDRRAIFLLESKLVVNFMVFVLFSGN